MADATDSDQPVDILAAEQFAVPGPDPALHHEVLNLPPDPIAEDQPHDVLAAEAFAMPSPDEAHPALRRGRRQNQIALPAGLNVLPVVALWLWRRVRRRSGADR